jgi:HD-GYP domain-containing protein (c-di-GMP phosphodiesterase class II)
LSCDRTTLGHANQARGQLASPSASGERFCATNTQQTLYLICLQILSENIFQTDTFPQQAGFNFSDAKTVTRFARGFDRLALYLKDFMPYGIKRGLTYGATLHDIGKIEIPDRTLKYREELL